MEFVQNLPFFGIVLALFSGVLCSILKRKFARVVCLGLVTAELVASLLVLLFVLRTGESYVYMMGHFPAPWGNEIRAGVLEALTALFFFAASFPLKLTHIHDKKYGRRKSCSLFSP